MTKFNADEYTALPSYEEYADEINSHKYDAEPDTSYSVIPSIPFVDSDDDCEIPF